MKKTNKFFALALVAVTIVFASCSKDDNEPVGPTQQEIEAKIVGKWKTIDVDGKDCLTNERSVTTYYSGGIFTTSVSTDFDFMQHHIWDNVERNIYTVSGVEMEQIHSNGTITKSQICTIQDEYFTEHVYKFIQNSQETELNKVFRNKKVTADYSQDIIGMWEGVEMAGPETYGNAEARIEYHADGTYTYYNNVDGYWVPSADADNEYNVDGDWLATRWRPEAGADYNYEWWDIDEIKDGIMKWSALREKEDGTRFTTTFTWKKIKQ